MADKFRYSKDPADDDVRRLQRETEDNFFSKDKNGNLVFDGDIECDSVKVKGESLYIGGIKFKSPIHSNEDGYWKYDRENKEFIFTATANPEAHASDHEVGGNDLVNHDSLTGFVANEHLPGIDEDDMVSDSTAHVPTQQSVKAYVDNKEKTFTTPDSLVVNTGGTPVGTVAGVQTLLDGSVYQLPEVTGSPGYDVEFIFSGITNIKGLAANFFYDGGVTGHQVEIEIYDYDGVKWDSLILVASAATYSYRYIEFPTNANYVSGGAAKLRFYHTTGGAAAHDLYVDFIALLT